MYSYQNVYSYRSGPSVAYDPYSTGCLSGVLSFIILLGTVLVAVNIIAEWKVFEKAGEKGWKAVVPFYSTYILFKISWGKGLYFFLTFIPFIGFVFNYIALYKLCRCFRKSVPFFVGMLLLQPIFMMILAFGKSAYSPPEGEIED